MADEEVAVEEKKSGNPMMMVLVILIVVLLAAVGGIGYMLFSKGFFDEKPADGQEQVQKKAEASDESKEYFKAVIKDLVLNITNAKGKEKLMKLSFSIKSVEPSIELLFADNKDEIIDIVIQQISSRSSEELLTVGGKDLLKEELLNEINSVINEATASNENVKRNNIKKLFFTTFVIK
ncbi:MAG TPA: flagellar basal body-associated FliL family protein [Arcobacter sp.]|nr:flagellar basal body-associated FliL family protein [Arcobacter sp.]HIP56387.1 flagellar basal body-associated FliL family protein [Arcobacter sp.]